jgi:uncharacterized protein YggU (UPF0235/DUF167 family)
MKINVTIKPNSKKGPEIIKQDDGSLIVYVREIAFDGKANEALIILLAKHFGVAKTRISIVRGHISRNKVIEIS